MHTSFLLRILKGFWFNLIQLVSWKRFLQCTLFLLDTIYLSHRTQVAEGTVSRKHTVFQTQQISFVYSTWIGFKNQIKLINNENYFNFSRLKWINKINKPHRCLAFLLSGEAQGCDLLLGEPCTAARDLRSGDGRRRSGDPRPPLRPRDRSPGRSGTAGGSSRSHVLKIRVF